MGISPFCGNSVCIVVFDIFINALKTAQICRLAALFINAVWDRTNPAYACVDFQILSKF